MPEVAQHLVQKPSRKTSEGWLRQTGVSPRGPDGAGSAGRRGDYLQVEAGDGDALLSAAAIINKRAGRVERRVINAGPPQRKEPVRATERWRWR
jgi:hypothetical protein